MTDLVATGVAGPSCTDSVSCEADSGNACALCAFFSGLCAAAGVLGVRSGESDVELLRRWNSRFMLSWPKCKWRVFELPAPFMCKLQDMLEFVTNNYLLTRSFIEQTMASPQQQQRKKAGGAAAALVFTRLKDLSPALCEKECNVKAVIVMESNAKDEANTSPNATLLVGDETACMSLVLQKTLAVHVRPGDILQLQQTQVVMKNSRIYLWGGKVERVGEFAMLFKETLNVSTITWVKDPTNPDTMVRNLSLLGMVIVILADSVHVCRSRAGIRSSGQSKRRPRPRCLVANLLQSHSEAANLRFQTEEVALSTRVQYNMHTLVLHFHFELSSQFSVYRDLLHHLTLVVQSSCELTECKRFK